MKAVSTRGAPACLVTILTLALGACSTTDQVARDQAAAAMNTAQQALTLATDNKAELDRVERTFNTTLRK
jgi:predicted transglutaminase-like cysteine proteinase